MFPTGKRSFSSSNTNPKHYFVQSGERFSFLARSRSAGIAALFQAESDTARGEKIRRNDKRMFGSGIESMKQPPRMRRLFRLKAL
jgi:hypothetical protein